MQIPAKWWAKRDKSHFQTYRIIRAGLLFPVVSSQIVVSPVISGAVGDTDGEESSMIHRAISINNHGPFAVSEKEVRLKSKAGLIYCIENNMTVRKVVGMANLSCYLVGIQYSFSYSGSVANEAEAESILSTLQ
jgi:hypothetical protein